MEHLETSSNRATPLRVLTCNQVSLLLLALAAIALLPARATSAAPLNIGEDQVPFQELGLTADAELGGRSVQFSGTAVEAPRYYFAPGLNVMSPTVITVLVEDPDRPAKVSLHRHFWNEPDLEGETDTSGNWSFTGRIDDSVGIALSAEEAADFVIMIWAGDTVAPEVPPILFDGGRPVEPVEDQ